MSRATKYCSTCKVELNDSNAYKVRCRDNYQSKCKTCGAAYAKQWRIDNNDKERARSRTYYQDNKDWLRPMYERSRIKRKYGVTQEQVEMRRSEYSGLCEICGKKPSDHIDHCHSTGFFRGLLCRQCNTALGMVADDPQVLRRAALYLEKQVLCIKGN